jgi:AAA+ superfamily predicted ATPase
MIELITRKPASNGPTPPKPAPDSPTPDSPTPDGLIPNGLLPHGSPSAATREAAVEPLWLREVRLRAARRVLFVRHRWERSAYAEEHLLAISHSEVDRALEPPSQVHEQEISFHREDAAANALSRTIAALADEPQDTRWEHLVGVLAIGAEEQALLALAIGAAVDPQLGRVFGYLQDQPTPSGATPALAADLFPQLSRLPPRPGSPVLAWQLLRQTTGEPWSASTSTSFEADGSVVRALMGARVEGGAGDMGASTEGETGDADWSASCAGVSLAPARADGLRARELAEAVDFVHALSGGDFVRALSGGGRPCPPIEIELIGPPGSGRRTLAARIAAGLGMELVAVDVAELAAEADPGSAVVREVRRALLQGAALALSHPETLRPEILHGAAAQALARCPLLCCCVEQPAAGAPAPGAVRRSVRLAPLQRGERLALWSLIGEGTAPAPVATWGLRPAEIATAARVAPAGEETVVEVCRRLLTAGTGKLVSALSLPYLWEDLVLPPATEAHLRELEAQARERPQVLDDWGFSRLTPMGRGTTALFAGPSGTGKTMATQVLARSLGLDCIRVDLAGVVSKYIGETEKQLREVFEACERGPALLFFDEADALFGKRTQVSDAHDRYANIEIDYLLQQMERFDGLAVLATNRKGDLDTAFLRRLRFLIDFNPPTVAERERLWRICLEGALDGSGRPLVGELDYPGLARELHLTGADIKSAALAAAYLACGEGSPIELRHVLAAGRRELEKQGQVVRPGQLEWQ